MNAHPTLVKTPANAGPDGKRPAKGARDRLSMECQPSGLSPILWATITR